MQEYTYTARSETGEKRKGKVEARDQKHAVQILRDRGLTIIDLKVAGAARFSFNRKVGGAELMNMTNQLSTMINSGLPLSSALKILETQSSPLLSATLRDIQRDVSGGSSLADALSQHKHIFNDIYIALVRAGEAAGKLDEILKRLAESEEKSREFRQKTKGALIYPAIVLLGMVIVAIVMMVFVIPQLTAMYADFDAELPLVTQMLIGISNFFRSFWWLFFVLVFGGIFGLQRWYKTEVGRLTIDKWLIDMPVMGKLRSQIMLTEFSRTLALLVASGIPILQSLDIVGQAVSNQVYKNAVLRAAKGVEKGMPLATMLAQQHVFPLILSQMISVGEETGELETVLSKVAQYFESEAEHKIRNLTTALEPLIMIVLGVGVGFIVIAVVMPLYQLTNQF